MPRRVASLTAPPLPLDPIVPHLAALLREAIAAQSCDWDGRETIFRALQILTRTCREARVLAQIDGLRWLCLFEWHTQPQRAPPRRAPRLCDGLPFWFDLHDECRRAIGPLRVDAYTILGVSVPEGVKRRRWFARRCAQPNWMVIMPSRGLLKPGPECDRENCLDNFMGIPEHYFAPDLDDVVPAPVARFVGFLRWWLACALAVDGVEHTECSAPGCHRPANVRDPTPEEADALCVPSYWPRLRSGVAVLGAEAAWPTNMPWCSCACEDAGTDEFFRRVHPCSAAELVAAPLATRAARRTARVSAARLLTASLERNAIVARRLRRERRDDRIASLRHYPLDANGLRAYHEKLVMALNVDVGILYAAMLLEGWPLARRPARPLPQAADWRDDGVSYIRAACAVQRLHRDAAEPATLVTSLVTPPRWMCALKDRLESIF